MSQSSTNELDDLSVQRHTIFMARRQDRIDSAKRDLEIFKARVAIFQYYLEAFSRNCYKLGFALFILSITLPCLILIFGVMYVCATA